MNRLIERLPRADRARLLSSCDSVPMVLAELLGEPGLPARHAYFPTTGFVALVAQLDKHRGLEVGMVGREGMLGVQLALGVPDTPLQAVVLGAGSAWRISRAAFQREMAASPALQALLQRYVHVLMGELSRSAGCLRFHLIKPRLARWLLTSGDRAQAAHFLVTHELLALQLGVRREGITQAAGALQAAGLIHYQRGALEVLDREGLEVTACSCYASGKAAMARPL